MTETGEFGSYYGGFWGGKAFRFLDYAKLRLLKKLIAGKKVLVRVVDLGCGTGAIAAKIAQSFQGVEMICVDSNPLLLEMAEKRGLNVRMADLNEKLPFENDSVDFVIMVDSIEHLESRMHIFREVKRILSDDGMMVAFTPPYDTLAWCFGEKLHRFLTRRNAGHISPFTKESLSWLLSVNFHDWRIGYVNSGLTMYGIGNCKKKS